MAKLKPVVLYLIIGGHITISGFVFSIFQYVSDHLMDIES